MPLACGIVLAVIQSAVAVPTCRDYAGALQKVSVQVRECSKQNQQERACTHTDAETDPLRC